MTDKPNPSDPWLDARLRNVPLPVGLLRRLEQVADPEVLRMDRALGDVPLPTGMLDRLRDISRTERQDSVWTRLANRPRFAWALAASLLLTLGVGYEAMRHFRGGLGGGFGGGGADMLVEGAGDSSAFGSADVAPNAAGPSPVEKQLARGRDLGSDPQRLDPTDVAVGDPSDPDSMEMDDGDNSENITDVDLPASDERRFGSEGLANELRESPLERLTAPREPNLDLAPRRSAQAPKRVAKNEPRRESGSRSAADPLGSGDRFNDLPDLDEVVVPLVRGMKPPIVAEYDLLFQLRYGQHPIVSPGANPELRTVQLPLVTSSAPWRRIVSQVADGRLPSPSDVRTEDFLAALDYHFPAAPEAKVAIEIAAGPAPLAPEGLSLLQVAVQAGAMKKEARKATHLTLVVDASLAMRRSDRWPALSEALDRLVEQMQPQDRLTVIAFSEDCQTVIDAERQEDLMREGSGRLARAIEAIDGRPAANLAAGVEWACRWVSRAAEAGAAPDAAAPARRMVIISGGRVDSGEHLAADTRDRLTELVDAGLVAHVVDMAPDNRPTGSLEAWARAGRSRLARATDPRLLSWRLLEALEGREPVVAQHVSLKVTFDPEVVASYRLLGHERTSLTRPATEDTEIDLRSGETATALFELTLKPGPKKKVATVTCDWQRPNYGKHESQKKDVQRGLFAASFAVAPQSLQMAAVAALAAETLRGSYFAPANRSLARVQEVSQQVLKGAGGEPSFVTLARFIRQAERVRTHRVKPASTKNTTTAKPETAKPETAKLESAEPAAGK